MVAGELVSRMFHLRKVYFSRSVVAILRRTGKCKLAVTKKRSARHSSGSEINHRFLRKRRDELEGVYNVSVADTSQVFHRAVDDSRCSVGRLRDVIDVFADEANGTVSHQEVSTTSVHAAERFTAGGVGLSTRGTRGVGGAALVVQLGNGGTQSPDETVITTVSATGVLGGGSQCRGGVNHKHHSGLELVGGGIHRLPLAFANPTNTPDCDQKAGGCAPNRFYMYGVVARLALLAASLELEKTDPNPEVY